MTETKAGPEKPPSNLQSFGSFDLQKVWDDAIAHYEDTGEVNMQWRVLIKVAIEFHPDARERRAAQLISDYFVEHGLASEKQMSVRGMGNA